MENLLSIGDCVSLAIRQCRRDIRFLMSKLLLPSIIELFGKIFLVWGMRVGLTALKDSSHSGDLPAAGIAFVVGFLICVPAEVWLTMRQLAYVRMTVHKLESYDQAAKEVRNKFWGVITFAIGFYFTFVTWIFTWALLFGIVSGVTKFNPSLALLMVPVLLVMMVVAGASLIVLFLPLTLLFVVLACEDKNIFQSLLRSYKMTFSRFFPTVAFAITLLVTWFLLDLALTSALQVFYGFEYYRNGIYAGKALASDVQFPMYLQVISSVWNSIVFMYLMPMFYMASGFYYYSMRMMEEGMDMDHWLKRLQDGRQRGETPGILGV